MQEINKQTSANTHDVSLRQIVQDKILKDMIKNVTQKTRGWVILVVDDTTTRILTSTILMSDLTEVGVSIVEKIELKRQPFPEMNVIYFLEPTLDNVNRLIADFPNESSEQSTNRLYNHAFVYFLSNTSDEVINSMKKSSTLISSLKALQDVNIDFLAIEKYGFTLDMQNTFHYLHYNDIQTTPDMELLNANIEKQLMDITLKLVSICATLQEYPYIRYNADQPYMFKLAELFQSQMNAFVAKNPAFTYTSNRGTLLLMDRAEDLLSPLIHESSFQAMLYDLLEIDEDKITYPAETNSGVIEKIAFLNENDALWVEFRHTHIAEVSTALGKRMAELSASAGSALGKKNTPKSQDLTAMASALRDLPQYREMLGKLSQHLYLAGKAMDIFTATKLLNVCAVEQFMGTGVDDGGKPLKHKALSKVLEEVLKEPSITELDKLRLMAIFTLTCNGMDALEKQKLWSYVGNWGKENGKIITNLQKVGGPHVFEMYSAKKKPQDEVQKAIAKASQVTYSNARFAPKMKGIVEKMIVGTLPVKQYPYVIAPPPREHTSDSSIVKKITPISLRKKTTTPKYSTSNGSTDINSPLSGERILVFIAGGATYSELRSIYEIRNQEKRDILLGATSFLTPKGFITSLKELEETVPTQKPSSPNQSANVHQVTMNDIAIAIEK